MNCKLSKGYGRVAALLLLLMLGGCLDFMGGTIESDTTSGTGPGGDQGPPPNPQSPPTISGTPTTAVIVSNSYSFEPTASDPDNDSLEFSIANKPFWAGFDTGTGALTGTPSDIHVGIHGNIVISVTDGTASASLNSFSISVEAVGTRSVTVSWIAPSQYEDGSALTDLSGYFVYLGNSPGQYDTAHEISGIGTTIFVIDNLLPGTYYISMTSYNIAGVESDYSIETSLNIS